MHNEKFHCAFPHPSPQKSLHRYRNISKISPEAYIFQRPFLRGLWAEGNLRFKLFGLAYSWKEIYRFCFVLVCISGQFPSTSPPPPRGLIFGGRCNGGFLALRVCGAYTRRAYFRNFTVFLLKEVKPSHDRNITNLQTFDRSLPPTRHFR